MKHNLFFAACLIMLASAIIAQPNVYFGNPYGATSNTVSGTGLVSFLVNNNFNNIPAYQTFKIFDGKNVFWESQSNFSVGYYGSEFPFSVPGNALKGGLNVYSILGSAGNIAFKIPDNTITIDGILNESYWNTLPHIANFPIICNGCITSSITSTFAFNVFYDSKNIYVGVNVVDKTPVITFNGFGNDDGIEVYFDAYECRCNYWQNNTPQTVAQTIQLIKGYNLAGDTIMYWPPSNYGTLNRTITGIKARINTTTLTSGLYWSRNNSNLSPVSIEGPGYFMEMIIPLSTFFGDSTVIPNLGQTFGFDIALNDTQYGNYRNSQLQWGNTSGVNNMFQTSSGFGQFKFGNKYNNDSLAFRGNVTNYGTLTITAFNIPNSIVGISIPSTITSGSILQLPINANSGLPISYSTSNAQVISISGNMLIPLTNGVVTITATQAGNQYYLPAATVTYIVTNKMPLQNQSIIGFNLPNSLTLGGSNFVLQATATSGLPLAYTSSDTNIVKITGNTLIPKKKGIVIIAALQSGNDYYNPAPTLTKSMTVVSVTVVSVTGKLNQSILGFNIPSTIQVGGDIILLNATATSGLPIIYASSNSQIASILNNSSLFALTPGIVTITASQIGNSSYNPISKSISIQILPNTTSGNNTIIGTNTLTGILSDLEITELIVYPNPTSGTFTIDIKDEKDEKITVYNCFGEIITTISKGTYKLNKGFYFLKYKYQSRKLIVE
ncbi:MAG: sugar-binding protein [Bacteroidota bacterium]|nr:sugar-binding protein [Bacteroidota bacterium]